jgi:hypothetical protein
MRRAGSALSIAFVLAAASCGGSDDGGSSGNGGAAGADGGGSGQGGRGGAAGSGGGAGQTGSGGTSGSSGSAGRGGTTGSSGGSGRGGAAGSGGGGVCGGIAGLTCDGDQWCDYPDNCGDGDVQGVCRPKPGACTKDCPGVCGCDGNFYCNACNAQQQGMDVSPDVTCSDASTSRTCTTDNDCTGGLKCCYPCGIPDCSNVCMTPDRNGECPLFP